jgi:hypothetical protein
MLDYLKRINAGTAGRCLDGGHGGTGYIQPFSIIAAFHCSPVASTSSCVPGMSLAAAVESQVKVQSIDDAIAACICLRRWTNLEAAVD